MCASKWAGSARSADSDSIYSIYPFVHIQLIFQTLFEAHIVARRKYDLTFASMVRNACNLMMHIYNYVSSEQIKSLV